MQINEQLRAARKAVGLKQGELAEIIGLTQAAVSAFELGRVLPTAETLIKLMRALNVSSPAELGYQTEIATRVERL